MHNSLIHYKKKRTAGWGIRLNLPMVILYPADKVVVTKKKTLFKMLLLHISLQASFVTP